MEEMAIEWTNPHSLWSLCVPLSLFLLILLAAAYFVRIKVR
jgi:hypothetical protein